MITMHSRFKTGGPLTQDDSELYVVRSCDGQLLEQIRSMNYVMIVEPRQQGKTSLLFRLMADPNLENIVIAYLDASTLDQRSEAQWYSSLCSRLLRQTHRWLPRNEWPSTPDSSSAWRDFLFELAILSAKNDKLLLITLDEVGGIKTPDATGFFSVMRDVYNSRQVEPVFASLTFALIGAFNPRDLIDDDRISPFNIAQRVRLPDFTIDQVRRLLLNGGWIGAHLHEVVERIHYWTNGQPYLCQTICAHLLENAAEADVDAAVQHVLMNDENHFPPIAQRIAKDTRLRSYVGELLSGARSRFNPIANSRQRELEIAGVVRADAQGFCVMRNRMCDVMMRELVVEHNETGPSGLSTATNDIRKNHLSLRLEEMVGRYERLTKQISAVDTDIDRAMESLRKQVLTEQRLELESQRNELATEIDHLEQELDHLSRTG